jgi:hypothetical protein
MITTVLYQLQPPKSNWPFWCVPIQAISKVKKKWARNIWMFERMWRQPPIFFEPGISCQVGIDASKAVHFLGQLFSFSNGVFSCLLLELRAFSIDHRSLLEVWLWETLPCWNTRHVKLRWTKPLEIPQRWAIPISILKKASRTPWLVNGTRGFSYVSSSSLEKIPSDEHIFVWKLLCQRQRPWRRCATECDGHVHAKGKRLGGAGVSWFPMGRWDPQCVIV